MKLLIGGTSSVLGAALLAFSSLGRRTINVNDDLESDINHGRSKRMIHTVDKDTAKVWSLVLIILILLHLSRKPELNYSIALSMVLAGASFTVVHEEDNTRQSNEKSSRYLRFNTPYFLLLMTSSISWFLCYDMLLKDPQTSSPGRDTPFVWTNMLEKLGSIEWIISFYAPTSMIILAQVPVPAYFRQNLQIFSASMIASRLSLFSSASLAYVVAITSFLDRTSLTLLPRLELSTYPMGHDDDWIVHVATMSAIHLFFQILINYLRSTAMADDEELDISASMKQELANSVFGEGSHSVENNELPQDCVEISEEEAFKLFEPLTMRRRK